MRPGVRSGGCAPPRAVQGGTPGEDATPSAARHPCPLPLLGGVPWNAPVPGLLLSRGFPRPRSWAFWGDPWSHTLSGLGASLAASPMWGSAPHPNLPRGGVLGGWTPCVSRKGCADDPRAWGSLAPQRCDSGSPGGTREVSTCPLLPQSFPTCPSRLSWERPPSSSNNPGATPQALGCQTLPSGHRAVPAGAFLGLGATCPGTAVALGPSCCPGRGAGGTGGVPWMFPNRVHQFGTILALLWGACPTHGGDGAVHRRDPRAVPQRDRAARYRDMQW